MYEIMIWAGAVLSLLGLTGIVWCILRVNRARKAGLDDEALRAAVAAVLPVNLAALFLSMFGLMLVVVGVILG
ncbi:hypothetical protein [Seohaeicola zhoushanensis]|uniref:Uncharacterized protein n=1 Tax=Seohaeicola zhoushanensis TaxID=1569283 RepID=A0A8J3GXM2_9RHOB|nr:hypothetical protein [Seohaeicola zhoushanensis]GHF49284.1 hypothetical protein GCM10017056_21170 [Seohaeicola zhoushanensis]